MEKCNETFVVNLNVIFRNEWMRSFWQPYFKLFVKSDVLIFFLAGDLTSVKRVVFLSSASDMKSWLLLLPASAFSALWGLMRKRETSSQGHNRTTGTTGTTEQQEQQRLPGLVTQFVTLPLRSEPMQRDQHASVTRADAHGNIPSTVLGTVGFCFTTSSVEAIHQPSRAWSGKKQYR